MLKRERPDCVIVFGDTNSTLAGALAAVKLHIPVIHIEAGLRSFNRTMPEEINRVVADHTADYLFAPTTTAMSNLKKEGLADRSYLTGDIMADVLLENRERAEILSQAAKRYIPDGEPYYLLTLHRPYNVDKPRQLQHILNIISGNCHRIIFPVHPRTGSVITDHKIEVPANITIIEPLGYLDFIYLQSHAEKIITDSGGIQKEAYILKKPCVTLRPETEWLETVESGWNLLLNPASDIGPDVIAQFTPPSEHPAIFGENVAEKMVAVIGEVLGVR
jgi:UDP-N-acetylglucosamine 2-epimerase